METTDNISKNKKILLKEKSLQNERENKIKEIFSDEKYIVWLENFTTNYSEINDSKFIKETRKLSVEDINNISKLSLLFSGIARYASNNYIYPIITLNDSDYYKIKYNNIGYYIGLNINVYSVCYCKRIMDIDDTFIDFNDIINNKQQENTIRIQNNLKTLHETIINYYKSGIPIRALNDTLEDSLWEIKSLDNHNKILRK